MAYPDQPSFSHPPAPQVEYIDVLRDIEACDIPERIRVAEDEMRTMCENDPEAELESDALQGLDDQLLTRGLEQSIITAVAQEVDEKNDIISDDLEMIVDATVAFEGANYVYTEDGERIGFVFERTYGDNDIQAIKRYAAFFEAIIRLEHMREPLQALLGRHASNSRSMIAHPDFLTASSEEQASLLESAAAACVDEITTYTDGYRYIKVTCGQHFVHPGRNKSKRLAAMTMCETDDNAIQGRLTGAVYPDVLMRGGGQAFRSVEDFSCGDVPCIAIYDRITEDTRYIPIDMIDTITGDN